MRLARHGHGELQIVKTRQTSSLANNLLSGGDSLRIIERNNHADSVICLLHPQQIRSNPLSLSRSVIQPALNSKHALHRSLRQR